MIMKASISNDDPTAEQIKRESSISEQNTTIAYDQSFLMASKFY